MKSARPTKFYVMDNIKFKHPKDLAKFLGIGLTAAKTIIRKRAQEVNGAWIQIKVIYELNEGEGK